MLRSHPVTFVIPTYRGLALLKQHLPAVFAQARSGDTVIISEDDPSGHQHACYWQKRFKLKLSTHRLGNIYQGKVSLSGKDLNFIFLHRKINGRFAQNVNQAVSLVQDDYFILLNDDVHPHAHCRDRLLQTITSDKKIFAVAAREIDINHQQQISGRNRLWWQQGRFVHARSSDLELRQAGQTAWVCGGSGIFATAIWRRLGGFDSRYYPAYWEDIDLSFQAQKMGYRVWYQPQAVVDHVHQTTNESVFGAEKIQQMSWRSGSRFAWKHANWWQKLQFLFFYPFNLLKQFPWLRWWWVVLFLALITRLSLLSVPRGLTVDEAAIAYNGYSLLTTRRDEWLNRLPLSLRSFGDYKAPLAAYVNGFFTTIWGLDLWVIRLPFALVGVGSIWLLMLIVRLLVNQRFGGGEAAGLLAGVFLTVSPWHLHYSHLGFENNFALLFSLWGSYAFLQAIYTVAPKKGSYYLCQTALFYSLALYSYHAAKVSLPLLLLGLVIYYRQQLKSKIMPLIIAVGFGLLLCTPLLLDNFFGAGFTRAGSSFLLQDNLTPAEKFITWGRAFAAHFTPYYLLWGQVNPAVLPTGEQVPNVRHGDTIHGVLSLGLIIFIGIFLLNSFRQAPRLASKELFFWGLGLIIFGTLPASLTTTLPHSNQAFLALSGFVIWAVGGFLLWPCPRWLEVKYSYNWRYLLVILMILAFFPYYHTYRQIYAHPPFSLEQSSPVYQQQVLAVDYLFATDLHQALRQAWTMREQVETIIVSTKREHEYIYALVASGISPLSYQGGLLSSKITYLPHLNDGDWHRPNSLLLVDESAWQAQNKSLLPIAWVQQFVNHQGSNLYLIKTQ